MSEQNSSPAVRDYDIDEYVPMEARYYGIKEMASVWICANANPTSWYMGTIIGALGLGGAFLSAIISNPLVYLILALVGVMGFRVASSTMGLVRVPANSPPSSTLFNLLAGAVSTLISQLFLCPTLSPALPTEIQLPPR